MDRHIYQKIDFPEGSEFMIRGRIKIISIILIMAVGSFLFVRFRDNTPPVNADEYSSYMKSLPKEEQNKIIEETIKFSERLSRNGGLYDQISQKLKENGFESNIKSQVYSKDMIEIEVQVGNKKANKENQNKITAIIKNIIKNNNLNQRAFNIKVTEYKEVALNNHATAATELEILAKQIMQGLKEFDTIGDIETDYQKSITIQTTLDSSNKNTKRRATEIQEKVIEKILESKELEEVTRIESYKIYIKNKEDEIIN